MAGKTIFEQLYEEGYAEGYRIGTAIASYKIIEKILKSERPAYYKENKHKIMRMSELQVKKAIYYLIDAFSRDDDIDDSEIDAYLEKL